MTIFDKFYNAGKDADRFKYLNVYETLFNYFRLVYKHTGIIPDTEVAKKCFLFYYKNLTGSKEILPIENLTQAEKENLVKEAGQSRLRCKILYLIKQNETEV